MKTKILLVDDDPNIRQLVNLYLEKEGFEVEMADRGDYKGIMLDTAERSYTGAYLERGRKLNKLISLAKPKDYTRFRILCESCLEHDTRDELGKISCPVMVTTQAPSATRMWVRSPAGRFVYSRSMPMIMPSS